MSRKYILSVLSILAIFLSWTFITLVSADTSVKNSAFNIINKSIIDEAPQVSTTIVISQVYGGGGSNTATRQLSVNLKMIWVLQT